MNKQDKIRELLFNKYSQNLKMLVENGVLDLELPFAETYMCPICMKFFSREDLNQQSANPLTLEDVPFKSLGGSPVILTCRKCNNFCGQNIDYHLVERMRQLDHSQFMPETETNASFERNGIKIQGRIRVEKDGTIMAIHMMKRNNPNVFERFIKDNLPDTLLNIAFFRTPVKPDMIHLALLKIGYLLVFEKYGYAFICDDEKQRIRNQLLNPDKFTYPIGFWLQPPNGVIDFGVPIITQLGYEAFLPVFPLITSRTQRPFAVIIPMTKRPVEEIISTIQGEFRNSPTLTLEMSKLNDDYLLSIDSVRHTKNWIEKRCQES